MSRRGVCLHTGSSRSLPTVEALLRVGDLGIPPTNLAIENLGGGRGLLFLRFAGAVTSDVDVPLLGPSWEEIGPLEPALVANDSEHG